MKWFSGDPDQRNAYIPADIVQRIERMGAACGMKAPAISEQVAVLLKGTRDFVERCRSDTEIPEATGNCLESAIAGIRYRIKQHFGMAL